MNQYYSKDFTKDYSINNNYYNMGGVLHGKQSYKYIPKANKKDPLVDQSRRIATWLKDMSIEDRARAMSIDNHSWLCVLLLKIFWIGRLKNYNAFSQKPEEKLENLTKLSYKLKHLDEYLRLHKLNNSDFALPMNPAQRTNRCLQVDAERRLFNSVRFCYHNEPYDTLVLENRSINEIDTTLAIFETVSDGNLFRTDLTKICDEVTEESNFFADWFNIRSFFDVNKILLASIERSILIKFKNGLNKFPATTYSWDTRNLVLNYLKGSEDLFKDCIVYLKEITPIYAEWFKLEDEFREYNIEEVTKKYPMEKIYFSLVCRFSCFSGIRDLKSHDRLLRELVMYLQSGEATTLVDSMLYQSFEECGRLRSVIFRRMGRFLVDKIFNMRLLDVADEIEKDKLKKPKRKRNKKKKNAKEEEKNDNSEKAESTKNLLDKQNNDEFIKDIDQELLNFSNKKTFEIEKYQDKDLLVEDDDAFNNEEIFASKKKQRNSSSSERKPSLVVKDDINFESSSHKNPSEVLISKTFEEDSKLPKCTESLKQNDTTSQDLNTDNIEIKVDSNKLENKKQKENSNQSLTNQQQESLAEIKQETKDIEESEKPSVIGSKKEVIKNDNKKSETNNQNNVKKLKKLEKKKNQKLQKEIKKANEVVIITKKETKEKSPENLNVDSKKLPVKPTSNTNKASNTIKNSKDDKQNTSSEVAPKTVTAKQSKSKVEEYEIKIKNNPSQQKIKVTESYIPKQKEEPKKIPVQQNPVQQITKKTTNPEVLNTEKPKPKKGKLKKLEKGEKRTYNTNKQREAQFEIKNVNKSMANKPTNQNESKNIKNEQNNMNDEYVVKNQSKVENVDKTQLNIDLNKMLKEINKPDEDKQENDMNLIYKEKQTKLSQKKSEDLTIMNRRVQEILPLIEKSQITEMKTARSTKNKRRSYSRRRYSSYEIKSIENSSEKHKIKNQKSSEDFSHDMKRLKKCAEIDNELGIENLLQKMSNNNQNKKNMGNNKIKESIISPRNEETIPNSHYVRDTEFSDLQTQELHKKSNFRSDLGCDDNENYRKGSSSEKPKEDKRHRFRLAKKGGKCEESKYKSNNFDKKYQQNSPTKDTYNNNTQGKSDNVNKFENSFPFLSQIEDEQNMQSYNNEEIYQKVDRKPSNLDQSSNIIGNYFNL